MAAALVDDTYAEAFKSIYVEFLVTARDRTWLQHAVNAATGHGSSTILCDCEAGVTRIVGPGGDDESFPTPDGRIGAIIQLHMPKFRPDRVEALEKAALARISQNVLTCPTAACFNLVDSDTYYQMGRKVSYFGNGWQFRDERYGRKVWVTPILSGEFVMDRRLGYTEGLMGGNLWFFGEDTDAALAAAERGVAAVDQIPGVNMPFPGGIAGSGSKAGSNYSFTIASTFERFCPTLQDEPEIDPGLPAGVSSVMEIIMNGRDLQSVIDATQAAIEAAKETPGLVRISAGNYGGKLGKNLIYLHPEKQPDSPA
ncbi:formylmethanofuran--tetrahydromethanopterin N-formyltransferase [Thiohalorhabdus methylotrophus]|uniref:Formylmethanofuran--tetrahydromethanopterin N-formyltransferase n=1 Tax=Thiohalorhabdus methylotrophus TaxID=3242694 RepID=A0ABV4TYL8_9GAMM